MQPNAVMTQGRPRRRARTLGLVAVVVGLLGGAVCWYLAGQQSNDAVAGLAPAPVGCDTTLEFDGTGTYTFYVETSGAVGEIEGNCDGADRDYEFTGDGLPRVSLTLVDADGEEIDLDRVESPTYDVGGASGTGIRTAEIDEAGEYVLTVEANADDVMVRVGKGREPAGSTSMLRTLAIVLAALGLLAGIAALLLGRGRTAAATPSGPAPPAWQPVPGQPAPNAPPTQAPESPPFAWPPGTPPPPPSAPTHQGWPPAAGRDEPLPPPRR